MTQPLCWSATILTLFPELFPGPLAGSLTGKALSKGLWSLETIQIRDYAFDKHKTVDDTCFGGGAGMVIKPDVVDAALKAAQEKAPAGASFVYLTPRGRPLTQEMVRSYTKKPGVVVLCGRYEGVDQRVIDEWAMDEVSLGDYVLTGGELAVYPMVDACVRLLPGVIGSEESLQEESFELGILEYPQYTRPQIWKDRIVPDVLLSGDHKKIAAWRRNEAEKITQSRRPDLWTRYLSQNGD